MLPGVPSPRGVQGPGGHHPPELALAQRLLQHQAAPGELELLIHLQLRDVTSWQLSEWVVGRTWGKLYKINYLLPRETLLRRISYIYITYIVLDLYFFYLKFKMMHRRLREC